MTVPAVVAIIERAREDPAYRHELAYRPDVALHGYDLSVQERAALIAGDEVKLQELGVPSEFSRLAAVFNRDDSPTP